MLSDQLAHKAKSVTPKVFVQDDIRVRNINNSLYKCFDACSFVCIFIVCMIESLQRETRRSYRLLVDERTKQAWDLEEG